MQKLLVARLKRHCLANISYISLQLISAPFLLRIGLFESYINALTEICENILIALALPPTSKRSGLYHSKDNRLSKCATL